MTPTVGATYETTRGVLKVLGVGTYDLLCMRADGRFCFLALSDWQTWEPRLVSFDAF